jgi:hypothetical protein
VGAGASLGPIELPTEKGSGKEREREKKNLLGIKREREKGEKGSRSATIIRARFSQS